MADKDVELRIAADGSQAETEFGKVAKAAENAGARIQSSLREATYSAAASTQAATSKMQESFAGIDASIKNVFSSLSLLTGGLTAMAAAKQVIEIASTFEQLEIRLNAVMGSSKEGEKAFNWIKQFAINTPYSVQQTTDAFMQLKNFGLDPMDGTLQKVSDASAKYGKSADTAQRVTLALGQAWARGKLQGQDTLQMIDAGIPVYDLLSKATGKTTAEIQDMSEKGTMGRDVMRQLIDQMGVEGAGAAAAKMNSYAGAVSNMGDAFENSVDKMRKQGGFSFLTQSILGFTEAIPGMMSVVSELFAAIGDVFKTLGSVVADVFSGIGASLDAVFGSSSEGMTGMQLFVNMLKVVEVALIGFRVGFATVFEFLKMGLAQAVSLLIGFANAAAAALKFDFSGAKAAWKEGTDGAHAIFEQGMANILKTAEKGRADIDNAIMGDGVTPAIKGTKPDDHPAKAPDKGKKESKMPAFKAELEARKEVEGNFFKNSLAEDEAFWTSKLDHVKKGSADERAIRHELFAIHKTLAVQKFTDEIDGMKAEAAAAKQGSEARIILSAQTAMRIGETYGWESKEYLSAQKEIRKASEDFDKEQQKLEVMKMERTRDHALSQIGMERDNLALLKSMGQISDQEQLAALRQMEEQKYQIEVQALNDKIRLTKEEGTARQQQLDELAKMKEKHDAEIGKLDAARILAVKKDWEKLLDPITAAFDSSIKGMILGTTTMQKVMANLGQAILGEFINMGLKIVKNWAATELAKTSLTQSGTVMRTLLESMGLVKSTAAQTAASTTTIITKKTEAALVIPAEAATAAGAAASSVAAIPIVGPGLAAAAYAQTMGMVMGGLAVASSAGGEWQVPADRLNLVHKNETILPAHIAGPLRDMVSNGGNSGGGGHTINISATDTQDVLRSLMRGGALQKALTDLNRNFSFPR
jgi:tape measure domain-containing protein